jgi:hypothetical protein
MMMTTPSPTAEPDWIEAARRLLGDDTSVQSERDRTVSLTDTVAHIRMWDAPATTERVTALRTLHLAVLDSAAVMPQPIGDIDQVALLGGRVYDACAVVSGLPLNRHGEFVVGDQGIVNLPLHETADHGDMLAEAARALSKIHESTRDHAALAGMVTSTATELHTGVVARWQQGRKRLGTHAASLPEVRRWLRCGNRIIPVAEERFGTASDVADVSNVLIHGNVWPAYLMVDDPSRPTTLHGITGWRQAAAGSPVLDLAQLSVRVTGWSEATVESVLGAYSDHTALPPATRRLVPVVAAMDLLDQVGRLLEIAYLDDAVANDRAQPFIRGGVKVLLRSLERLTNVLAPPEPVQRRFYGGVPRSPRTEATGKDRQRSPATRPPGSRRSPRSSPRRTRREG